MLPILLYKICLVNKYVLDGTVASFTSIKRCHSRICQPHIPEVISIFQSLARVVNNPLVSHLLYLYVTISMVTYLVKVRDIMSGTSPATKWQLHIVFSTILFSLIINLQFVLFVFLYFFHLTHTHTRPALLYNSPFSFHDFYSFLFPFSLRLLDHVLQALSCIQHSSGPQRACSLLLVSNEIQALTVLTTSGQ